MVDVMQVAADAKVLTLVSIETSDGNSAWHRNQLQVDIDGQVFTFVGIKPQMGLVPGTGTNVRGLHCESLR